MLSSNLSRMKQNKIPPIEGILFWLALLNDFRTFDWASEYKYPTVVLDQMKGLLAKYENV